MNKIQYFLLFLSMLMYSCQEIKKQDVVKTQIDLFKQDLKNKPKYFLSFWGNMTTSEYNKVERLLINEGKFDVFGHYLIGTNKFDYEPIIDHHTENITGIRLNRINKSFYKLFEDKYNLPPLVEKSTISAIYIETNPLYAKPDTEDFYAKGNYIRDLEVSNFLETYNLDPNNYKYQSLAEPLYFDIKTEKANIKVSEFIYTQIGSSKLITPSMGDKYEPTQTKVYFFKSEPYFEALDSKDWRVSKERIIVILEKRDIYIEYYPPNYLNEKSDSEKDRENINKEIRKNRFNQVKDEI